MAFYCGGDTSELEYSFFGQTAGASDNVLKLYRAEVDPSNLPSPSSTDWTLIDSQSILDKVSQQNEILTSNLSTDKSTIQWGDKTLQKTSIIKLTDDFLNKTKGNTTTNPNISKYASNSALQSPNGTWIDEISDSDYGLISTQDTTNKYSVTSNVIGEIPQQIFSFNLIEEFQKKYGDIPKISVAEKVAWLKSNLSNITGKWYGYGSNPTGNKAYLQVYQTTSSNWIGSYTNTSSIPSLLSFLTSVIGDKIDDNGFVHFLAYTDKARTTDDTFIVLTGHGLSTWDVVENTTLGVIKGITGSTSNTLVVPTTTGQTSGDVIRKYHTKYITKIAETGTTEGTIIITSHGLSSGDLVGISGRGYSRITVVDVNTFTLDTPVSGTIVGDNVVFYAYIGTQTAESTVISSTIYTDYASIELTLKAPENLITATNTLEDIVTDFSGKVSGSVVENANISKSVYNSILSLPSNPYWNELSSYNNIAALDGLSELKHISTTDGKFSQQLFSFNIVSAVEKHLGQPIPAVDKIQWCKDNLNSITCAWTGYGSCPSGNKAILGAWRADSNAWNGTVFTNTTSSPSLLTYTTTSPSLYIASDGFAHFLAYTDASDGVTASTIYTDYVKLTIKLKYIPTYDFYTDTNTRRDVGLTNIVLVKRQIGDMTSDFSGKISGSVVENPNIAKSGVLSSLMPPSTTMIGELSNTHYDAIKTLNGLCSNFNAITTTNGAIPQQLFSFNLIEIAQRQLGTSIPGADTASKVQWLKDNLSKIDFGWYGYGSCPSGSLAYLDYWNVNDGYWAYNHLGNVHLFSNTATSPSLIPFSSTLISNKVSSDGFIHFLAYTNPNDGVTASVINTDYVKLTLTFKSDTVGYEYITNNSSEISVTTNNKASSFLAQLSLTPIATALYGNSNSALKSAFLNTSSVDVYSLGTGSNTNQIGYGVNVKAWNGTGVCQASCRIKNLFKYCYFFNI